ncbi:MAG: phosphoribosylformylglycinamidine synthase subunit PurL [Planctomycetota bacterium]
MRRVYTVTVAAAPGVRGAADLEVLAALRGLRPAAGDALSASADSATATLREEPCADEPGAVAIVPASPAARAVRDEVYFLELADHIAPALVELFAREFLAGDPLRVAHVAQGVAFPKRARDEAAILVMRKAGVMDPIEGSVLHALGDAGVARADARVRTATRHRLTIENANVSRDLLESIALGRLSNAIVDDAFCFLGGEPEHLPDPFRTYPTVAPGRVEVAISKLNATQLVALSRAGGLSLNADEMLAIQMHFAALDREPSDIELETIAQTWSEHCCHKTLTGPIDYQGMRIQNLLKETIFAATREINAPFCWSVFKDNAGVIAIDENWGLTIKVETHNHPSALEPYGGAGTGIGGVIRDTLGTGLGALPIFSTDVFCFGPLDVPEGDLPAGALHPLRLLTGVAAGVRDYGNRIGIPTVNGAICFHPGYLGNPLVFCGSGGLIPRAKVEKQVIAGDLIVAIGGRTGRDGIHGATFSSRELTEESEQVSSGAVQIGNPIEEKKVLDALLRARDEDLYHAVTDCGAGGFSSAVGEMAEGLGARVELDRAPLKYAGLSPCEIWISEAQERMVLAVPRARLPRLLEILGEEEVEGAVLGEFTNSGRLELRYQELSVGELELAFLHGGRPRTPRVASRPARPPHVAMDMLGADLDAVLRTLIGHPSIASKEVVVRQYDHEVQGRVVLKPFTGPRADGPNDGAVLDPLRDGRHTIVVGCGLQILLGEVDAFQMGAQSVDEAVRNVVASGGSLDRLALLDNFAWGDVHDPQVLGALIECARGAADAARAYRTPFVSGKDSLHNTYRAGGVARSIPHTLLVTAVSVVPGAPRAVSSEFKRAGSALLLLGPAQVSDAGSQLQLVYGGVGGMPCKFDGALGTAVLRQLERWLVAGRVLACHDLSEGGLAIAAAEMAIGAASEGVHLELDEISKRTRIDVLLTLFGEGPHRFLLEVAAEDAVALVSESEAPVARVGTVTANGEFRVTRGAKTLCRAAVAELRGLWKAPLSVAWPEVAWPEHAWPASAGPAVPRPEVA